MHSDLRRSLALLAPIAAITIVGISMSLGYPLFALRLEDRGVSGTLIGLSASASAVAMVLSAFLMPMLMKRLGIGGLMLGSLAVIVVFFLMIGAGEGLWYWTALRLVYGFAGSAMFFASEFWIVAAAPAHLRGRIVAIYAISLAGGFALGPMVIRAVGHEGWEPLLIAAGLAAAAAVPVAIGLRIGAPRQEAPAPGSDGALSFLRTDPSVMASVLLFGMIEYGAMALLPNWARRSDLDNETAVTLLAVLGIGSMLAQLPVGWAADRFDRRRLLMAAAIANGLICVALPLASGSVWMLYALVFCWGGTAVTLYTVSLVELGARYDGARLASATAMVIGCYGMGALLAPTLFGAAMDAVPPDGLLHALLAITLGYLALLWLRARRRA